MNQYFKNINTLEELWQQYKELLKVHHPDNGSHAATMPEINAEQVHLFKFRNIGKKFQLFITLMQETIYGFPKK